MVLISLFSNPENELVGFKSWKAPILKDVNDDLHTETSRWKVLCR